MYILVRLIDVFFLNYIIMTIEIYAILKTFLLEHFMLEHSIEQKFY